MIVIKRLRAQQLTETRDAETEMLKLIEPHLEAIHDAMQAAGYRPWGELNISLPRVSEDAAPILQWKDERRG
jgi:hypothetical protein